MSLLTHVLYVLLDIQLGVEFMVHENLYLAQKHF